jgi:hypothetical protein
MASQEQVHAMMAKLRQQTALATEDVAKLQAHIDELETANRAASTDHHTSSSPGSHYSHHSTSVADITGILERATSKASSKT